ncbi:hypothetical protein PC116_g15097 [Phytophthora cactorum]|uniref:Uncharacterized protein n=1 Tax=Phytophthora cactorum TaxID=29920 RepID=A0A8T1CCD1_9STRA|nr:hypothetical protein PC114_g12270 [Phytophthora cactorum]KAG2918485.1 hypothetical protein PC117_g17057 [Phytophthora cactorum]KAG3004400.1 hypothetical protein PC120_g18581 [Phytophthora cactorum]KAG3021915.1 hypothetical protein PC119_g9434 [Phytophthora cactorum]KAG3179772.1 hypothetical protein C6341_g7315 [Phytophthora cactorum]
MSETLLEKADIAKALKAQLDPSSNHYSRASKTPSTSFTVAAVGMSLARAANCNVLLVSSMRSVARSHAADDECAYIGSQ